MSIIASGRNVSYVGNSAARRSRAKKIIYILTEREKKARNWLRMGWDVT